MVQTNAPRRGPELLRPPPARHCRRRPLRRELLARVPRAGAEGGREAGICQTRLQGGLLVGVLSGRKSVRGQLCARARGLRLYGPSITCRPVQGDGCGPSPYLWLGLSKGEEVTPFPPKNASNSHQVDRLMILRVIILRRTFITEHLHSRTTKFRRTPFSLSGSLIL